LESDWTASARWVDTAMPRPRWRFTLDRRITNQVALGLEFNPAAEELNFRGNWFLQTETQSRPALVLGTSSDRIGTPPGNQAYFLTISKQVQGTPLAPYVAINYSEFERGMNFPFGVNIDISPSWSLLPMNDGRKTHLLLNYRQKGYGISFMWVWLERPGLSISTGF
jgi:hypothetical protein